MKRSVYLSWIIILVVLFFGSSVYGGWKNKVAANQVKAAEYIIKLKNGANPATLKRPIIRRAEKARANSANRAIREAMEQAEKLARAGKTKLIKNPEFKALVSDEEYQQLEKKYRKGK